MTKRIMRMKELVIGSHRTFGQESPKRNDTRDAIYTFSLATG